MFPVQSTTICSTLLLSPTVRMPPTFATVAPLILPTDPSGRTLEGYILPNKEIEQKPAALWLRLSNIPLSAPTLRGCKLEVNQPLAELLRDHQALVAARLQESHSVPSFFLELQNIVEQVQLRSKSHGHAAASRPASFFQSLKSQLDAIGWSRITHLGDDLSSVTLSMHDSRGRTHTATLALPPSYPADPPLVSADLPAPFVPGWGPSQATLPHLLAQLEAAVGAYQWVWDSLDDVDEHAWVIEPLNPPRASTTRRLALGNHVSLSVVLDPLHPGKFPECRFLGSDSAVAPLRQKLYQNRGRWQEGRLLRENLEEILEQRLPSRESDSGNQQDAISTECSICYAYRLPPSGTEVGDDEGAVPDVTCGNPSCGKPYHRQCLAEWLLADTTTRSSFNTLFGSCPYCSDPITVKAL